MLFPSAGNEPPRALGLVVTLQRRRIFVNLGQVTEISVDGAHLPGGAVELERFNRRTGEMMASELYGQHTGDGTIVDVAISPSDGNRAGWEVSALAVSHGRSLLPGGPRIVPWDQYPKLFQADPLTEQLAGLRDLQPADLANAVEGLPPTRRDQIAAALNDEELADLLEEMPEQDQVRLLTSLGPDRGADVVEEMQPDDAADLLAEMPAEQRERLLTAMESIQADDLRRLLRYDATTAGGLMTSQPLIVDPGHAGGRDAGPDHGPGRADHRGRAGVRVRAAPGHADRPLPGQRRVPAAAAPAAVHAGRPSAWTRAASSSGPSCPNATWRPGSPPITWSASRSATKTAAWSARLPWTTSWTTCCPRTGGKQEAEVSRIPSAAA